MSVLELASVFDTTLAGASAAFDPGLGVVLGTERDGAARLVELVAGIVRPRRGTVRIGGSDPFRSAKTRRTIGAVLAVEPAANARSVEAWLARALAVRGDRRTARELLSEHALGAWAGVRPDRVPEPIRRQIALALALCLENPAVLIVHEPLACGLPAAEVIARLAGRARAGAVVLALTASPLAAAELGGSLLILDQGRFVRKPGKELALELAPGSGIALRVKCADGRRLAARLVEHASVGRLEWRGDADELTLRGDDADALALAIARSARGAGIAVSSIEPVLPALDDVRAANAALWRAAYDAAYRTAQAHARARAEALAASRALAAAEQAPSAPSVPPRAPQAIAPVGDHEVRPPPSAPPAPPGTPTGGQGGAT